MRVWRRWLLALTLCVFAVAYGAPTSLAAHAGTSHAAMRSDCPEPGELAVRGSAKTHADTMSACCIAHCLPAMPASLPPEVGGRIARGEERLRLQERGEGQFVPVPLPPPRSHDCA